MVGDQDGSPAGGDVLSFARIGFVTDAQDVECCGCESVAGYFRVPVARRFICGFCCDSRCPGKRIAVQPIDAMKTRQTHNQCCLEVSQ